MSVADARRYLKLAQEDRQAVASMPLVVSDRIFCYEAQQAVEKAIKAVILLDGLLGEKDEDFRDHDIGRLLDIVEDGGRTVPATVNRAIVLTPCAVRVRYGQGIPPVPKRKLLDLVDPVMRWAEGIVT